MCITINVIEGVFEKDASNKRIQRSAWMRVRMVAVTAAHAPADAGR